MSENKKGQLNVVEMEAKVISKELKNFESGATKTRLWLENMTVDENGKEHKQRMNAECWQQKAKNLDADVKKGDMVVVKGQLRQESWDDNGTMRYSLYIKIFDYKVQRELPKNEPPKPVM